MSFAEHLAKMSIAAKMPEANARYCWHLAWQYEDEFGPPNENTHANPGEALNQMISLWNSPRTLIHMAISRRNA